MDIKWKNISRQIFTWCAVAVILVFTFVGVGEVQILVEGIESGNELIGNEFEIGDYFSGTSFEESSTYERYCGRVLEANLTQYVRTGKFKGVDQHLNADVEGTIQYQTSGKKKKLQYGDKITQKDVQDGIGIIKAEVTLQVDSSEYYDENGRLKTVKDYYLEAVGNYDNVHYYGDTNVYRMKDDAIDIRDVENIQLTIRIPSARIQEVKNAWEHWKVQCKDSVSLLTIYSGIILAALIVLIIADSPKARSRFGAWVDGIWLEILLIFMGGSGVLAVVCAVGSISLYFEHFSSYLINWCYAGMLILELVFGYCFMSMVRRIKERKLIKSSVCYKAIHFTKEAVVGQKKEWDYWKNKQSSTLTKKEKELKRKRRSLIIIGIAGVICTLFLLGGFFPFGILCGCFMVLLFKKMFYDYQRDIQDLLDLEKVLQQIYEISNGNLRAQTDIEEDSLYYKATKDLESIGQGMERSVEEQLKGERMKIDLITNVSHDLKTPLTSIISYVDLLAKDETLSDEARDYVTILGQKSERLKNIVVDLFDLAKSTSGNAKVDFSILDMRKLMDQTMVEMEDKIQASGFEIVTDYEVEQAHFEGDANRMYRVVQNILENALKYSLKGSRIYIRICEEEGKWMLSIKNTASYRMQFTEEEILERFYRGDKSRTTEGNGLGLSIAQSFTRLCGGDFKIKIDGDQFMVKLLFPKKELSIG